MCVYVYVYCVHMLSFPPSLPSPSLPPSLPPSIPPCIYSPGKAPEQFIAEKIEEAPKVPTRENTLKLPRIPKKSEKGPVAVQKLNQPSSSQNGATKDRTPPPSSSSGHDHHTPQALNVSNHIPFAPQIVEVNPPLSESEETGSIHGNSVHFMEGVDSEPSSPGSDSGLRIDLAGSELEGKGRVRMAPPANRSMLRAGAKKPNRISLPGEPYYDSSYSLIGGSESMALTPTAFRPLRRPPGETLSALATSLAVRRAAELRDHGPGADPYAYQEEEKTGFSTIYPPEKRAIAVVDPDEKRTPRKGVRQIKRRGADNSPSKKSRRLADKANDIAAMDINMNSYMDASPSTNGLIPGLPSGSTSLTGSSGESSLVTGLQDTDEPPLELGEGLMADTVRCVERSFQTRLDSLANCGSDDLGYKYFSEKVMIMQYTTLYSLYHLSS